MYGYIYKTTCLVNNKIYIGQHKWDKPELDPKYLGSGKLLRNAVKLYGKENFICELLACCNSFEELNQQEKYWEAFYGLPDPRRLIGYNITTGGQGVPGYKFTNADKAKISVAASGRTWVYKNSKSKFILANELPTYLAQGWQKGRTAFNDNYKIICLKTGVIYNNAAEVAKLLKLIELKYYLKTGLPIYGKHYMRLTDYNRLSQDELSEALTRKSTYKLKVLCVETNELFDSLSAAAKAYHINLGHLSECCNGKRHKVAGYHWRLVNGTE